MKSIKSIFITAKCSDLCNISFEDEKGEPVGEHDGYVPDWMPEDHYGDYIELHIDVETGQILNWSKPTQEQLTKSIK